MVKVRSKLLSKSTSLLYVLVFIVVAVGLYFLFRDNFKTREGNTLCNVGDCVYCNTQDPYPDKNCTTACARKPNCPTTPPQQPSILDMVTKSVGEIVKVCRAKTKGVSPGFDICITDALVEEEIPNFTLADTDEAIKLKLAKPKETTLIGNITSTVMKKMGLQPQQPQGQPN